MMGLKQLLFLCGLYVFTEVRAQDTLFYYMTADSSRVGVRDQRRKVIIPATFPARIIYYAVDKPIETPTIEFYFADLRTNTLATATDVTAMPMGEVYSRTGAFLYRPQFFDNGPDFWYEGVRRYVADDKIGFVDVQGNKLTSANWGFATPFNYGYAEVYEGKMRKQYDQSGEHWSAVPVDSTGIYYLIDRTGKRVEPLSSKQHDLDYYFKGEYYPYPFHYTAAEQAMVDRVQAIDAINTIYTARFADKTPRKLQFELVQRPIPYFPYHILQAYDGQRLQEDFQIWIDQEGRLFFHSGYSELQPLEDWIKSVS